jgi:phosphoribosylanthranilate isomerase
MTVQIYAATSVADALRMIEIGVDQVGFVAGDYGEVHGELTFEQARAIVDALRGAGTSSALTMSTDLTEILQMAAAVQPDIIHISSDTTAVNAAMMQSLGRQLPAEIKLMKAIHVAGPESIKTALAFAPVSDYLLLDTKVAGFPGVGATGVTHDWQISREIVRQTEGQTKVILAGGLTPANVEQAIETVRPWAVDSNTGTNLPGDPVAKEWHKVEAFTRKARSAFGRLTRG